MANIFITSILDVILNEVKNRGLSILLLFGGLIYFGYIAHQNSDFFYNENISLKEENKELRNSLRQIDEMIVLQKELITNQREILMMLKHGGKYE